MEYTEIVGPNLHGPCITYSVYEDEEGELHIVIYKETEYSKILQGIISHVKPEDIEYKVNNIKRWKDWEGAKQYKKGNEVSEFLDKVNDNGTLIDFTMIGLDGRHFRYVYFSDMGEAGEKAYNYLKNNE